MHIYTVTVRKKCALYCIQCLVPTYPMFKRKKNSQNCGIGVVPVLPHFIPLSYLMSAYLLCVTTLLNNFTEK